MPVTADGRRNLSPHRNLGERRSLAAKHSKRGLAIERSGNKTRPGWFFQYIFSTPNQGRISLAALFFDAPI